MTRSCPAGINRLENLMEQLTLFGTDQVVGTGRPRPWPFVVVEPEAETVTEDPNQLTFDHEDETGAAA